MTEALAELALRLEKAASPERIVDALQAHQVEAWRAGAGIPAEEYLALGPARELPDEQRLDVVFGEFVLRRERGDAPDLEELVRRFPRHESKLRLLAGLEDDVAAIAERLGPADDAGPPVPKHLRDYEVLAPIGMGGMGTVYEARHARLGRKVALKVLRPGRAEDGTLVARFESEMRAVGKLEHENLVRATDAGEAEGFWFIALELVDGTDAARLVREKGPLAVAEACRAVRLAALGLHHAHEHGLVHRDVKPSNLMVARDGQVKVLDLGLALSLDGVEPDEGGALLGTFDYVSPEQIAAPAAVDRRADVYGLGATLWHLLAGAPPFSGPGFETVQEKLDAHAKAAPGSLRARRPEVPEALAALVGRMLAKSPADRPSSALEVARSLEPFSSPPAPRPRARGRGRMYLAVAAAVLLALVASHAPQPAAGPPIRVGVLHSLTGTMGTSESVSVDATLLAIEEINHAGGVLGRPVEPIVVDGRSDWGAYAAEAETLITEKKVAAIFGCWTSASRKRVKAVVEKHDHLLVYPMQYEGLESSPNIVYTGATPNQQVIPALAWAVKNLGPRIFIVGSDYLWPHATIEVIQDRLPALGATCAGVAYVSLDGDGTRDAIAAIVSARPSVVLELLAGDGKVQFVRALRRAGVRSAETPTLSFSSPQQGLVPADIAGDYSAWNYFSTIDTPRNREFVARYREKFGPQRVPTDPVETSWFGAHLWAQAAEAARSVEPRAVREAVRDRRFEAAEGEVRVDPSNLHTWRPARIARARDDGSYEIVWSSQGAIAPDPFPTTRPVADWERLLQGFYTSWGDRWENPGRR